MQDAQKLKPKRLNLNKSPKYLSPDECFYALNHEVNNQTSLDKATPIYSNYLACDLELPAGENYNIGRHYADLTNELYCWTLNSNGVNFIWRINGDGVCQIVYIGDCLILSGDPKHEITQFRAYLKRDRVCKNQAGKQLIWVDGSDTPIGQMDVEASIATNFFTTPFFERCADPCAYISMCVPEPDGCLKAEWVPYNPDTDAYLSNYTLDKGMKFMYRYRYYDQRASEWSDRSSLYFQNAKGCFDSTEGRPRCLKFRIPIGNPLVDTIEFAVSEDGGLTWYTRDIIEKYKKYNSAQQFWYERDLAENVSSSFSEDDCAFDYIFCNDTQRTLVTPEQVNRAYNPMPRSPQGFVRVKEQLGFYNYIKGNCPVDKTEIDKIKIELNCDTEGQHCKEEYAKVTVRAVILNKGTGFNGYIFRLNGNSGEADDTTDPAWFSSTSPVALVGSPVIYTGYDQTFNDKTRNFIPYIEGTDYWGEMEQWSANQGLTNKKKVGVLAGFSSSNVVKQFALKSFNGTIFYQEYTFTVPKGTKGYIRLASHHQTSGNGSENQSTSTQVIGVIDNIKTYEAIHPPVFSDIVKEIYFDTCGGDVDLQQAFAINDLYTKTGSPAVLSAGYEGYITDMNDQPVEGLEINAVASDMVGGYRTTTDFNGYYSFQISATASNPQTILIMAEQNCTGDFSLLETFAGNSNNGDLGRTDYQITSTDYTNKFYALVKVPVLDCDNKPVAGIRVAINGSKYKVSDINGIATFKLRNYANRQRYVTAMVMDKNNCFSMGCLNNCNPCMPVTPNTLLQPCFEHIPPYTLNLDSKLNTVNTTANQIGLKKGGRYAFGVVAEGDCGVESAVYPVTFIDVPTVQQVGFLAPCTLSFDVTGVVLPTKFNKLKIVRSINLNPFDLQWIVDDFSRTADGKIILTIQSLNDYNAQYFFKTNTVYKYLAGDRVVFIKNGDGQPFGTLTNGILDYLTLSPFNDEAISGVSTASDANYFNQLIIEDNGKLGNLKKGAVIEIQTPIPINPQPTYFEICTYISVNEDGTLAIDTGTFSTFDTYLVNRQIGKFPAQYFESKTPSDFWGESTGIDDTGKPHFVNKYEDERRYGRNITLNSATQFNYFGELEKTFGGGQDDIVAISIKDDKIGALLSEFNNYLFQVSDGLLRLDSGGVIQATSADSFISNPQAKLRGEYGCQYADIGSIFFGDGFFKYIDSRNNADIIHNYQYAKEAGTSLSNNNEIENSCSSYFRKRTVEKENWNKSHDNVLDHYRFSVGMNKSTGVMYQTLKTLRQSGIGNAKYIYEFPNDTIMYNPVNDSYLGFAAMTPEGYGELDLSSETGSCMVTFQNSLAYIHPIISDSFNEFFGITTDWVIGVSLNKFPEKIKIPISYELQSEMMFYASKVTTGKTNFLSEIPPIRVKEHQNNKWNASFLNNINSRGGLYNGENARGYFTAVTLIRDNTDNLKYGTIDENKRRKFSELDEIIIKFEVVEQSGYTNNL